MALAVIDQILGLSKVLQNCARAAGSSKPSPANPRTRCNPCQDLIEDSAQGPLLKKHCSSQRDTGFGVGCFGFGLDWLWFGLGLV